MTREQQRQLKADKLIAKQMQKFEKKQERIDKRNWDKMVAKMKAKGAWVDG